MIIIHQGTFQCGTNPPGGTTGIAGGCRHLMMGGMGCWELGDIVNMNAGLLGDWTEIL